MFSWVFAANACIQMKMNVKTERVLPAHFTVHHIHTDLNVAAVDVHASDHASLGGHVCPINHLLAIVEVQSHGIVQALSKHGSCISLGRR